MEWFNARYPASEGIPIIIHSEKKLSQGASLAHGMRVIDGDGLEKLKNSINSFAEQLADPDVAANPSEVAKRLSQFSLNDAAFFDSFSVPVKNSRAFKILCQRKSTVNVWRMTDGSVFRTMLDQHSCVIRQTFTFYSMVKPPAFLIMVS